MRADPFDEITAMVGEYVPPVIVPDAVPLNVGPTMLEPVRVGPAVVPTLPDVSIVITDVTLAGGAAGSVRL